jgi:hypothetical protein
MTFVNKSVGGGSIPAPKYVIDTGQVGDPKIQFEVFTPVQDTEYTVFDIQANILEIVQILVSQNCDEYVAKNYAFTGFIDEHECLALHSGGDSIADNSWYELQTDILALIFGIGPYTSGNVNDDSLNNGFPSGSLEFMGMGFRTGHTLKCHHFVLKATCKSAVGTNQKVMVRFHRTAWGPEIGST